MKRRSPRFRRGFRVHLAGDAEALSRIILSAQMPGRIIATHWLRDSSSNDNDPPPRAA